jgi:hypothetical protein
LTLNPAYAIIVYQQLLGNTMFENLEIRRVANGFILVVNTEDDTKEFVYDTERKLLRSVKQYLGERVTAE